MRLKLFSLFARTQALYPTAASIFVAKACGLGAGEANCELFGLNCASELNHRAAARIISRSFIVTKLTFLGLTGCVWQSFCCRDRIAAMTGITGNELCWLTRQ